MLASKGYSKFMRFIFLSFVLTSIIINDIPSRLYLSITDYFNEFKKIESSYKTMTENFMMKQFYEERIKELQIQFDSMNYNNNLLQEEIISIINNHCLCNNIIIDNVNFVNNDEVVYNEEELEESSPIEVMRVAIEFKCSYDNLLLFIDDLKSDTVELAVFNMRIINWNNDIVNVAMDLNFYSINEVDII